MGDAFSDAVKGNKEAGFPTPLIMVFMVFDRVRRVMGWALPIICGPLLLPLQ